MQHQTAVRDSSSLKVRGKHESVSLMEAESGVALMTHVPGVSCVEARVYF